MRRDFNLCFAASAAPPATPCEDGLFCTANDECNGSGTCVPGAEPDCSSPDDECNGVCDEDLNSCQPDPVEPGLTCDDGDLGTSGDVCDSVGGCAGTPI